ncbi:undecaprenyl-diphosphatase [Acetitomaculum ruminis DSM 5522]|uniref:Undecaprenyl-diphosphatase n=1 Tax=Acetitomaculum ruminis DSM 5522 TaxID=1120918 RepID=A0A1I1A6Q8_9FIRM|nr:phosphatase PAP2 family protein [Acetitomaculum ruminis]SFB33641.1 undecaprenyl-diphosphatase [Acetitomaculum ruminis DSM 5522]
MKLEFAILDALQTIHTPLLDSIMIFITKLGNGGMIMIAFTILLLIIPKTRKTGMVLLAALVLEALVTNLCLKPLVARIRPYEIKEGIKLLISAPVDYSFPSGHTAAGFALVSALFFEKKKIWIPVFLLAFIIAFSRLYLYVHYPSDVLCGAIIGIISGFFAKKIVEKIIKRRKNKEKSFKDKKAA